MSKHNWSYSAIKDFKGCARRYHAVRVQKLYPRIETEATRYGELVHKALENYVQDGTDMPLGLEKFEPTGDAIRAMCGEKLCEYKMALTAEKQPTGYKDADVWVRGIADVLIINGENARVCDYKTGGAKYPDKDQLELMALMTFAHFPQVQSVKGALLFVSHDVLVRGAYARKDIDKLWVKWDASTALLDKAFDLDVWYPNPTPLCRWCPHEVCEHYVR